MAEQAPIIVKKIKKGAHAHHGGAWKIAYADFVTAMMAFFLLLWLLNAVTEEQLEGISNYFAPVSASQSTSGAGGVLGGKTIGEEGAVERTTSRPSVTMNLPPPKAGSGTEADADEGEQETKGEISEADAEELLRKAEQEQFEEAEQAIKDAIESVPSLKNLAENLMVDDTPEGLRIQLLDREGLAMFPSGGSEMYLHAKKLMELVSTIILKMPQDISISGHTDASKFVTDTGYGNWELSADRANAARRELMHHGVPEDRVKNVVGRAATEPLFADDPKDPRNRRLSIVLLRGTGEQKLPEGVSVEKTEGEAAPAEGADGAAPAEPETPDQPSPGEQGQDGQPTPAETPPAEPAPAAPAPDTTPTPAPAPAPSEPAAPAPAEDAAPPVTEGATPPAAPTAPATGFTSGPRSFTIGPAPETAPEEPATPETGSKAPAPAETPPQEEAEPEASAPKPETRATTSSNGSVTIRLGQ
jgi:chemotaxis protein MotB